MFLILQVLACMTEKELDQSNTMIFHMMHRMSYSLRAAYVTVSIYYTKFTRLTCKGLDICPLPCRRTRQLLSGRSGCARGQTSCGLDAKRQTAVTRVSEPAVSR